MRKLLTGAALVLLAVMLSTGSAQAAITTCNGQAADWVGTDAAETMSLAGTESVVAQANGGGDNITSLIAQGDLMCGGPGADALHGGGGPDELFPNDDGASNGDTLYGDSGNDILHSGTYTTHATGIFDGFGNDTIYVNNDIAWFQCKDNVSDTVINPDHHTILSIGPDPAYC